jgi:hypothetical protein
MLQIIDFAVNRCLSDADKKDCAGEMLRACSQEADKPAGKCAIPDVGNQQNY